MVYDESEVSQRRIQTIEPQQYSVKPGRLQKLLQTIQKRLLL